MPAISGLLVIVPCGEMKIWDKKPKAGPTAAMNAYISPVFAINRAFAEKFGQTWMILIAKYGFIEPGFEVPGPYNVTFKRKQTGPISTDQLRDQVRHLDLDPFTTVIGLGGKEYRKAIEFGFAGTTVELRFPFSGLIIGKMKQATKLAIETNDPLGIWK